MTVAAEQFITESAEETEALAARLAIQFRGGECIALHGDLGAGKTQFVRGLARGLGADPRAVGSPTFVLLHVYNTGRLTLYHLDAYRARGAEDFEGIGFGELLEQGGVVVIEWAARVENLLPAERIDVQIEPIGLTSRRVEIRQGR